MEKRITALLSHLHVDLLCVLSDWHMPQCSSCALRHQLPGYQIGMVLCH